jgi:hypothetical protein
VLASCSYSLCSVATVRLVCIKNVAADQVASQMAASDAPLAGYPWRLGSLCSVRRAFFLSKFGLCVTFCGISKLCSLRRLHISAEQYVAAVTMPRP